MRFMLIFLALCLFATPCALAQAYMGGVPTGAGMGMGMGDMVPGYTPGPFATTGDGSTGDGSAPYQALPRPLAAPDVQWVDGAGNHHNLAELKGKVVVLNFWATWCGPCVMEMPSLNTLQQQFKSAGLEVLPISVDQNGIEAVAPFYRTKHLSALPVAMNPGGKQLAWFGVHTVPITVLINRAGQLVGMVNGYGNWTNPDLIARVQQLLAEYPAQPTTPAVQDTTPTGADGGAAPYTPNRQVIDLQ